VGRAGAEAKGLKCNCAHLQTVLDEEELQIFLPNSESEAIEPIHSQDSPNGGNQHVEGPAVGK